MSTKRHERDRGAARDASARDSEALQRMPLAAAAEGILAVDVDGRCRFANDACARIFGLDAHEQLVGVDMHRWFRPNGSEGAPCGSGCIVCLVLDGGGEQRCRIEISGGQARVDVRAVAMLRDGRVRGAVLVFADAIVPAGADDEPATRRRELAETLRVVAHDLGQPSRAIEGFARILRDRHADALGERGLHYLDRVAEGAARMTRLVRDVGLLSRVADMDGSRMEVPGARIADEMLRRLAPSIAASGGCVRVASGLPILAVDPAWAAQALCYLVSNALGYTRTGEAPNVEVTAYRPHAGEPDHTDLEVRDRGPGVAPEHRERIFRLFQRGTCRDGAGTGAGLTLVRRIAERHGGAAWVRRPRRRGLGVRRHLRPAQRSALSRRRDPLPRGGSGRIGLGARGTVKTHRGVVGFIRETTEV